jgi:hypothetical protein
MMKAEVCNIFILQSSFDSLLFTSRIGKDDRHSCICRYGSEETYECGDYEVTRECRGSVLFRHALT